MYNAFISYSHAADGKLAPALQNALEKFAKPWYKLRNLNIFRDEASLTASPHLWSNIQVALQHSEYLIYMASVTSANSKWINKEIEYWLQHKSLDKLLIALTDGEILWDDKKNFFLNAEVNSLPAVLENKFREEPFYIDLRNLRTQKDLSLNNPIFKKEVLKLAAQLHGKEPKDLASEEVSAHNKMIRWRNAAIGTLMLLFIAAVCAAWFANSKRIEANEKTIEAKLSKDKADSSALIATIQSKIASEQRDSAILARSQADHAARFAQLQKDTAQIERDNAIKQERIAFNEKEIALGNYLLSEAKSASEYDPTLGLRLAEAAMNKHNDPVIEASAYKIYRENSFYKITGSHARGISSVTVSPDGKYILSASKDSTAKIWDQNGKMLRAFKDPSQLVCATFSPDGKYILTGSREGIARLWDMNQKIIREFKVNSYVEDVAFSPNGKFVLTGSFDSTARLWNLEGKVIQELKGHTDQVTAVAFSPGGQSILSGSYDGTARLWDLNGNTVQLFKNNAIIYSVAWSPDGKNILTGSLDKSARLWDVNGKMIQEYRGHSDAVISVTFSPDGKFILTGSWDKTAALWDIQGNLIESFIGNPTGVNAAFTRDGKNIITAGGESVSIYPGSADHTIRLWEIRKSFREINNNSPVLAAAFSPGKKYFITGSLDNTVRLFTLDGNLVKKIKGHAGRIMDLAFSPDGKFIVSGSMDSTARLWDLQGNSISEIIEHAGIINSVSFSPDGKSILTASEDKTAKLWDLSGKVKQTFSHSSAVRAAVFSPDGKTILTGTSSFGEVARLWKLNGKLVREYYDNTYSLTHVNTLAFAPDGKSFLTGLDDYKARLWGLDGNLLREFNGHSGAIASAKFSPDGKTIITASKDGTARLWDLKGNTIQEYRGHSNVVVTVNFSPDGKSVLTGSFDGTVRVWNVPMALGNFLNSTNLESFTAEQRKAFRINSRVTSVIK